MSENVDTRDRAFQYGDGLFETIAIRGRVPRLWAYHYERLAAGCMRLGIAVPAAKSLLEGIDRALADSDVDDERCVVKIIVSAGSGGRGYGRGPVDKPAVFFSVGSAATYSPANYRDGVETTLCATRLAIHSATAGLKTLNRLEQVLARAELHDSKFIEGLTADADDNIVCGTMSNVFVVEDGEILTPSLDRCGVAGVMRRHVMETLRAAGTEIREGRVAVTALTRVNEVFLTNSQFGVLPVASCGNLHWGAGRVTKNLMELMAKHGILECRL